MYSSHVYLEKTGTTADRRREKFENWLSRLPEWHDHFIFTPVNETCWTFLRKPLSQARVALVSTAGVHLRSQPPFDVKNPDGDWSYRVIPGDTDPLELMISDDHYDHSDGDRDINCLFGISRLAELAAEGFIGEAAPRHFGLMGFIPDPSGLLETTAPEIAAKLVEDRVDVVLLTPG
jgi:D-proline reductase (dithiol) PrdB